jgi:predicted metal-dependent phosphoesterase TrpH
LVVTGKAIGLTGLSLTDHDNMDGVPEFVLAGLRHGFRALGGVELSVRFWGVTHVLGLDTYLGKSLSLDLSFLKKWREERNELMYRKLYDSGIKLEWNRLLELSRGAVMGKPHFANAMVERGYVPSREVAFRKYLARGKPGYADKRRLVPKEAFELLLNAGMAPVLAHPISLRIPYVRYPSLLSEWKKLGLIGLEVFHPSHGVNETCFFRTLADDLGLVATCGSDYHGANKKTPLSWVLENSPIPETALERLDEALIETMTRLNIPLDRR